MNYLGVRNWDEFQHYKGNSAPPWIKLYRNLLNDYDFNQLSELERGRLVLIWLLAASTKNRIPDDAKWVATRIGAKSIDLDLYVSRGFLEVVYRDSRDPLVLTEQNRTEQKRAEQTHTNGHYEIPEHDLQKLLSALTDKDSKTEASLRRLAKNLILRPADFAEAREAAMSESAKSPTAVAVSVLKKRRST